MVSRRGCAVMNCVIGACSVSFSRLPRSTLTGGGSDHGGSSRWKSWICSMLGWRQSPKKLRTIEEWMGFWNRLTREYQSMAIWFSSDDLWEIDPCHWTFLLRIHTILLPMTLSSSPLPTVFSSKACCIPGGSASGFIPSSGIAHTS